MQHKTAMFKNGLRTASILFNWRYWPMELLYFPLTVYILFIGSLRTGKLFYFSAANPKIPLGGFAGDSKYAIITQIPSELVPVSIFVSKNEQESVPEQKIIREFHFPIIAKPDIGEGGFLVQKLNDINDWRIYHRSHPMDYIIQEYIDGPLELSVHINDAQGEIRISGITEKRYLTLTGDGVSTINELLSQQKSSWYCRRNIRKQLGSTVNSVVPAGIECQPLKIGNWSYGTGYFRRSDLISERLTHIFAEANASVGLFHYARYDIKCRSEEALLHGDFFILEINGVKGEPIHIYDPETTLFGAYREIFRHWEMILKISNRNRRQGAACTGIREGSAILRNHRKTQKASLNPRINP